jgi:uncharacterized YceG family protein
VTPGPPPVPGGRSDDERERARRERDARRTGEPRTAAGRRSRLGVGAAPRPDGDGRAPPRSSAPLNGQRPRPSAPPGRGADRARAPRAPRSRGFGLRRLLLAVGVVFVLAVAWFLVSLYQPFAGDGGARKTVTIKDKASVGDIGSALSDQGIVSSGFFFELRATLSGKRGDLKPGSYTLREDMSYSDAIAALEQGPPQNAVRVSVPEGRSRIEIAASLKKSGLKGNYLRATRGRDLIDARRYGATSARDLEGFLWPATYELKRGQSVTALVRKQVAEFDRNFSTVSMRRARAKNLTPYDVLIIASLVERETAVPRERRVIAGVIYNRLAQDQSLGIDATVRFILNKWDGALTQSDLNNDSPYNTRKFKGLPPGPIGNPGLASIRAAANPANTDNLFYVANPCKPGTHTFHRTLADFNAAVARYNQARAAAGNRAPKGC